MKDLTNIWEWRVYCFQTLQTIARGAFIKPERLAFAAGFVAGSTVGVCRVDPQRNEGFNNYRYTAARLKQGSVNGPVPEYEVFTITLWPVNGGTL